MQVENAKLCAGAAISSEVHTLSVLLEEKEGKRNTAFHFGSAPLETTITFISKHQQHSAQTSQPLLNPAHCAETKEIRDFFSFPPSLELICQQELLP